jgi:hypothetical protein
MPRPHAEWQDPAMIWITLLAGLYVMALVTEGLLLRAYFRRSRQD